MSRVIPAALLTALNQQHSKPYYAVELHFDSGILRFWTGYGSRSIEGNSYTGAANLLNISGLNESTDMSAKTASITLSGVPSSIVAIALTEQYQGRNCRILYGERSVSDVIEVFGGLMDTMDIMDGPDSSIIELTLESRLVELERIRPFRYTHESQIARADEVGDTFLFANDIGLSFITDLQDKEVLWGRSGDDALGSAQPATWSPGVSPIRGVDRR